MSDREEPVAAGPVPAHVATTGRFGADLEPVSHHRQRLIGSTGLTGLDLARFGATVMDAWLADYRAAWPGRQLVEVTLGALTYLFDAMTTPGRIDNRVIGVIGRSTPPSARRDRSRMAGHPSPQSNAPPAVDRGHLVALSMGGGYDINLLPQVASINRRGRWRAIERYCSAHPGTFIFIHALYDDCSDHPSSLDYGWPVRGDMHVDRFANR